jgi:hypothetical protein
MQGSSSFNVVGFYRPSLPPSLPGRIQAVICMGYRDDLLDLITFK